MLPSVAELLPLDLLVPGLSDKVCSSPHHTTHEALLGIRIKSKTEKLVALVQLREDKVLRGGRRQELLGVILSLGKHTLN